MVLSRSRVMSDLCFSLLVLISIRRGLVKLKREVTRLLSIISGLTPFSRVSDHIVVTLSSQVGTWSVTVSVGVAGTQ